MIQAPEDMQGESLVPLLKGNHDQWDREAYIITIMSIHQYIWQRDTMELSIKNINSLTLL